MNMDRGLVALITILIILLVLISIGIGISLLGIGEMKMGFQKSQSARAYYLANLCAEQALMKLKEDINYPGDEEIEEGEGNCQILPIEGNWIIKVIGNFQNQVRKMKIVVSQVNPEMVIDSWREVAEF